MQLVYPLVQGIHSYITGLHSINAGARILCTRVENDTLQVLKCAMYQRGGLLPLSKGYCHLLQGLGPTMYQRTRSNPLYKLCHLFA